MSLNECGAVVLVFDRLNPAFLGPYGNTWVETPAFNELAAQSALVEQCLAESLSLSDAYDSYWTGQHQLCRSSQPSKSLANTYAENGHASILITDEPVLRYHSLVDGFSDIVFVGDEDSVDADSSLAAVMSCATDHVRDAPAGSLIWIHAAACASRWTAPYSFRERFADEDDPPPPDFRDPPSEILQGEVDPDVLLGLQQAYAAEAFQLDQFLAPFLESVFASNSLFALTSPRAYPLGEHGVVGAASEVLAHESLHVPLMVRFPNGENAAERIHRLWQPSHVGEFVRDWVTDQPMDIHALGADRAATRGESGGWAFRTKAWLASGSENEEKRQTLFAKPDDRFEANNLADRCPEIYREMHNQFQKFAAFANEDSGAEGTQLPRELIDIHR